MGEKGEGSGREGGGKWGERGRELGMGYPPVHPLIIAKLERTQSNEYQNKDQQRSPTNNERYIKPCINDNRSI